MTLVSKHLASSSPLPRCSSLGHPGSPSFCVPAFVSGLGQAALPLTHTPALGFSSLTSRWGRIPPQPSPCPAPVALLGWFCGVSGLGGEGRRLPGAFLLSPSPPRPTGSLGTDLRVPAGCQRGCPHVWLSHCRGTAGSPRPKSAVETGCIIAGGVLGAGWGCPQHAAVSPAHGSGHVCGLAAIWQAGKGLEELVGKEPENR